MAPKVCDTGDGIQSYELHKVGATRQKQPDE